MKNLSNTEAGLKKGVSYKKKLCILWILRISNTAEFKKILTCQHLATQLPEGPQRFAFRLEGTRLYEIAFLVCQ